jgi:hypothetical protein
MYQIRKHALIRAVHRNFSRPSSELPPECGSAAQPE